MCDWGVKSCRRTLLNLPVMCHGKRVGRRESCLCKIADGCEIWLRFKGFTLQDSGCSGRQICFSARISWQSIPFAAALPRDTNTLDVMMLSRHRSIGLCTCLIAAVNFAMFSSEFCDDSGRRVHPWGDVGVVSQAVCVRGLDEVQGRFQIHLPEPCVRCFFLLLHT